MRICVNVLNTSTHLLINSSTDNKVIIFCPDNFRFYKLPRPDAARSRCSAIIFENTSAVNIRRLAKIST